MILLNKNSFTEKGCIDMELKINNSAEAAVGGPWHNPGSKLYNDVLKANKSALHEVYLQCGDIDADTPFSRSGCKYPHHIIKGNEIVLSIPGVKAAFSRARQQGVFNGEIKKHLERHYRELGIYEDSEMANDKKMNENFIFIENVINHSIGTNLSENIDDGGVNTNVSLEWIERFVQDDSFRESVGNNMDEEDLEWALNTFVEDAEDGEGDIEKKDDDVPPNIEETGENGNQPRKDEPTEPTESNEDEEEKIQGIEPKSRPKAVDAAEGSKNGVRRKKLYIAFIEWAKAYNHKNAFGSIFDKDIFDVSYPFVPHEMRYFYRLANPMLCVLGGDLTFFPVAELRKVNADNKKLSEMLIFAATPNDLRVFSNKDKQVYLGKEQDGEIVLTQILGETFDLYIQNMIKKGDILNGPIEEKVDDLLDEIV